MGNGGTKENQNVYFRARKQAAMYNERLSSREGAAEMLGISPSTLADYELGITKFVPVDKVVLMADLYNCPELRTGYCKYECPIGKHIPLATSVSGIEGIALRLMELTAENYYGTEANKAYMSVSQFKDFNGTYGKMACEFEAMEKLEERWKPEPSTALLVGSYVDSYIEGTLDDFKKRNPEIFTQKGELKAPYKKAEEIIARIERDEYFMKYLSGEKQRIMTGNLFGCDWKIKMDSYIPGVAIVDLKVMASITDLKWVKDIGYLDFVRYWGYDIQGAIYQKIVELNTGKKLPFFIAAVTKENEPDIRIIQITQNYLDEALSVVSANINRVLMVKNGDREPDKCELCDCCRHNRVLKAPISIIDLTSGI